MPVKDVFIVIFAVIVGGILTEITMRFIFPKLRKKDKQK